MISVLLFSPLADLLRTPIKYKIISPSYLCTQYTSCGVVSSPDGQATGQGQAEPGQEEDLQPEVAQLVHDAAGRQSDDGRPEVLETLKCQRMLKISHLSCQDRVTGPA